MDSFSISDDGKPNGANLTFKKPMGFVKKTRTQVTNSAVSHAQVGITGTALNASQLITASPIGKKTKKQKSVSSAIVAQCLKTHQEGTSVSKTELSPHGKDPVFLPHTGIDYPFLKKRP